MNAMKTLLLIISILTFGLSSSSQDLVQIKQRWFSKSLKEFYVGNIIDTVVKLPNVYEKTCYKLKDTIFYHAAYKRTFGGGKEDTITETNKYAIIYLSSDTLIMSMPEGYRDNERRIDTFFSEKSLVNKKFKLQRLQLTYTDNYFLSTEGKAFSLTVDRIGNIIYQGRHNTNPYMGTYKGKLTKLQMVQVIDILKTLWLEYQPDERECAIDAAPQTLIVYANNRRYSTKGCEGNYLLNELLNFFWDYNTDKQTRLNKYSGKLQLEE